LEDRPRPRRPKQISAKEEAAIVEATLKTKPRDATHWSVRTLAKAQQGVSKATIQRIWRKYRLRPHRVESFKFSTDPAFVPKVRDIVGLYLSPPNKAILLSVNEKSQIQALDRTQPILPLRPGLPERPLRANIDETVLLVVITEQGENRNQCEEQRNLFGFFYGLARRGT
jgi:hypothetical protein